VCGWHAVHSPSRATSLERSRDKPHSLAAAIAPSRSGGYGGPSVGGSSGCQRSLLPTSPSGLGGGSGLFSHGGTTRTSPANASRGAILQVVHQFPASPADGLDVQPRDGGHQAGPAMPGLHGCQGSQPATLLFIQAAEEQVQTMMKDFVGMIARCQTVGTLTGVRFLHGTSFDILGLRAKVL